MNPKTESESIFEAFCNNNGVRLTFRTARNEPTPFCFQTRLINERTIGADRRLRPLQIVPRLKCQPVEGSRVEDEGKAQRGLGSDGMRVGDEGFDVIGGDAGASSQLGGVECVRDQVGVQQDVARGSQGLRGVYFRMRGELDQFHGGFSLSDTAAQRISAYSVPCQ